ncbi:hypothetical protein H4Q26_009690 [Puccinia striiformis f. sp. tritici PST-130]|nr:hypothetical protein H4Q26_009690 [Puccinia striiformis f. sp. tritici PST-130]
MTGLFRKSIISRSITTNRSNPWQETNLSELKRQDIRIVRRRSGGGTVYHVSGSAFRITSKRAYHHGTMLIDSNLDNLRGALRPTPNINIVDSKAVGSVRSPVTSLIKNSPPNDTQKEVNHVQFMNTLSREFSRHYYPDSDVCSSEPQVLDETELQSNPIIQTGYEELKVEVTYKNGVISGTKINLASYSSSLKQKISESFPIGKPIDF